MAFQTFPIPAGWSWTSSAGGPWSAPAAGTTLSYWVGPVPDLRWDVERWDESVWARAAVPALAIVEWRPVSSGAWTRTDRVLAVATRAGAPLWYQGPRASQASATIEQSQTASIRPAIGDELRILVELDSGQELPLWHGRVANLQDRNRVDTLSTMEITGTDLIGWAFQAGTDSSQGGTPLTDGPAGNLIWQFFSTSWLADIGVEFLTDIDRASGLTCYGYGIGYSELSVSSAVAELVRGDLGLLFTAQNGRLQFRPHNWWWDPAPMANIGSGRTAPPGPARFELPADSTTYSEALVDLLNQIYWKTLDAQGVQATQTTQPPSAGSLAQYGRRVRSDSVKIKSGTDLVNAAFALQRAIGLDPITRRLRSVTFPTIDDSAAQEFAARVTIGAFVRVLEETDYRVESWTTAAVVEIQHRITADQGWSVTLGLETRLPDVTIP